MSVYQRILLDKNGTLTDLTPKLNDWDEFTVAPTIVALEDKLIIASIFPFNHKWFEFDGANVNAQASDISVEIWNDQKWESAVNVIDYTGISGNTWSRNGLVQFEPNIDRTWQRERLATDVDGVVGFDIYNYYWARFTFSNDLSVGTVLKYIGNRFSDDSDLFVHYPDLNNTDLMDSFETGKTDWAAQHFAASDIIIQRLISNGIILDKSQILDWNLFKLASLHKAAEIIYYGLRKSKGEAYKEAQAAYKEAINLKYFRTDQNATGTLSGVEFKLNTRELGR